MNQRKSSTYVAMGASTLAALFLVTYFVPTTESAVPSTTYGSRVTTSTTNFVPSLKPITATRAYLFNDTGSGATTDYTKDVFYIHFGPVTDRHPAIGDIRVAKGTASPASTFGFSAGTMVKSGDSDITSETIYPIDCNGGGFAATDSITSVTGCLRWLELDGIQGYTPGDAVYLDISSSCTAAAGASGALSACDIRLNSFTVNSTSLSAGTLVASTDIDMTEGSGVNVNNGKFPETQTFSSFSTISLGVFDANEDNTNPSSTSVATDTVYLSLDDSGTTLPAEQISGAAGAFIPRVGDVRLNAYSSLAAGSVVKAGDLDMVPTLQAPPAGWRLARVGTTNGTDRIMLTWGDGTKIHYGDLQLNTVTAGTSCGSSTTQALGTFVSTAATCAGVAADATSTVVKWFYVDRSPAGYGPEDCVYLHRPNAWGGGGDAGVASPTIEAGDIRMTACDTFALGTQVATGNGDLTGYAGVATTAMNPKWFDADRGQGSLPLRHLWRAAISGSDSTLNPYASGSGPSPFFGGERVYVDLDGSGTVTAGDLRIVTRSTNGTGTVGSTVAAGNWDVGRTLTASTKIYVTGSDGAWSSSTESVYLDNGTDLAPTAGDIRLSGISLNGCCLSTTSNANGTGAALSGLNVLANADGDVVNPTVVASVMSYGRFGVGDSLYLSAINISSVLIPLRGDVRLTAYSSNTAGTHVDATSSDKDYTPFAQRFGVFSGTIQKPAYGRWNKGLSGSIVDDAFYLNNAYGSVGSGDARLVSVVLTSTYAAGTKFVSGDNDNGATITNINDNASAQSFFVNQDSSRTSIYDSSDYVYFESTNDSALSEGDVRVTSATSGGTTYAAGTIVVSSDNDRVNLNTARATTPGGVSPSNSTRFRMMKFLDNNHDGTYAQTEDMVWGVDSWLGYSYILELGDLYLTGSGGGTTSTGGTTAATTTTTATTTATTATTTSSTASSSSASSTSVQSSTSSASSSSASSTGPAKTTKKPTPGFEAVAAIAGLAGLLAVVSWRRR